MRSKDSRRWISPCPALLALGIAGMALTACDELAPGRFSSTLREAAFQPTAYVPGGRLTLIASDQIRVSVDKLPVLPRPVGGSGFLYEGWLTAFDPDTNRVDVSTGRFRMAIQGPPKPDPADSTGAVEFTYDGSTGDLQVISGGEKTADGQPLPPGMDLTDGVTFFVAIELEPDDSAGPGVIHPLVTADDLPPTFGRAVDLIAPADLGLPTAGDFSLLDGDARLNVVTGEFRLRFSSLPVFQRTSPPEDPGLVYQAWFVDDDTNPPRYQSIGRFLPAATGEGTVESPQLPAITPGDLDGDGVPEPLDFERVLVSVEPDGLNAQQPVRQGLDTSSQIFPFIPYRVRLPAP